MTIIHIKATIDVEDRLLSELMTLLLKNGFKPEKYLGLNSKIIMAKKEMVKK